MLEIRLTVCRFKGEWGALHSDRSARAEFYSKHAHPPMSYMYIFAINFFLNPLPSISCLHNFEGSKNFLTVGERNNHEDSKRRNESSL